MKNLSLILIATMFAILLSACNSDYFRAELDDYHYSVDIPKGLVVTTATEGSTGWLIYSVDKDTEGLANSVELSGSFGWGEEFTPEYVRSEYEKWTDVSDKNSLVSRECSDNDFMFTTKDEKYTRVSRYVYHEKYVAKVTICYDKDHEDIFTDEVVEHVLSSIEF